MLARSAVLIITGISLQAWLMCNLGFAATSTASLSVSVTVEAGCQVSKNSSVDQAAAGGARRWGSSVSVDCSLPVPYRVVYDSSTPTNSPANAPAGPGSSIWNLNGRPGTVQAYDRDRLERGVMLMEQTEESESAEFVIAGLPAGSLDAAHCAADVPDSGIVTVTVIY